MRSLGVGIGAGGGVNAGVGAGVNAGMNVAVSGAVLAAVSGTVLAAVLAVNGVDKSTRAVAGSQDVINCGPQLMPSHSQPSHDILLTSVCNNTEVGDTENKVDLKRTFHFI